MGGFFNDQTFNIDSLQKGKVMSCVRCGLNKYCLTPKMKPYGKFKKKVMFIGEAPGETEDRRGKPFQGKAGNTLKTKLQEVGFSLFEDAVCINACLCRPPNNETPSDLQIDCCRKRVIQSIKKYKPKVIFLLGNTPIQSVIGRYWKKDLGGVFKWRGFCIPEQNYNAWVVPTFHPSYIMRQKKDDVSNLIWGNDFERGLSCIKKPLLKLPKLIDCVTFIHDQRGMLALCAEVKKKGYFAFDFEATGIRPYAKGHRLYCTSVATAVDKVFVFENNEANNKIFVKLLRDSRIKKGAHNIQFENLWSRSMLKTKVKGWDWCSQTNAHILDNRKGVTGLKFQSYANYGVVGYDEKVSQYIKGDKKKYGNNAINKLDQFIAKYGIKELMLYCAIDSLMTFRLIQDQKSVLC